MAAFEIAKESRKTGGCGERQEGVAVLGWGEEVQEGGKE